MNEPVQVHLLLAHAAEVTMGVGDGRTAPVWNAPADESTPVPRQVGVGDVEQIEQVTAALRALDHRHGGGACRARRHFAHAIAHARHVQQSFLLANVLYRTGRLHLHRAMTSQALRFFQLDQIAAQDAQDAGTPSPWPSCAPTRPGPTPSSATAARRSGPWTARTTNLPAPNPRPTPPTSPEPSQP
jgi:hypothetical protein